MFKLIDSLPEGISAQDIEHVVKSFCQESSKDARHIGGSLQGLYQQTIENIGNIIVFKPQGNFLWMDVEDGKIMAYAKTHVSKDVDNSLCYYMTQAWVHPSIRGTRRVKDYLQDLRLHAKQMMCRHIIVVSSRGEKAYCRFLGRGWAPYVTLLKEDIYG